MTTSYRLSVLDQSPVAEGDTTADAIANTRELARLCDDLGYYRYWLAEHHASPGVGGTTPEALIGPLAIETRRMRIGAGGIMMPHYSPFKVAETFSLLSALAPDRIDLGVGRALGSDGRTAFALQRDRSKMTPHDFPDQLAELLAYLGDDLPADHPFASLAATLPSGGGTPAPWLLGTSMESANWAASAGLPYCFADFINQEGAPIAAEYRRRFQPSRWLDAPYLATAIFTIAASTQEEAEALATPGAMMFSYLARGQLIPVPSLEKAMAWAAPRAGRPRRRKTVVGTPAKVRADLDMLGAQYGADELMLVNIMSDHAARLRSYALIAAEYGLAERAAAA